MDREDHIAVIGTWERHHKEPGKHDLRNEDPRGWQSHHAGHTPAPGMRMSPAELVEAIRLRAYEIYSHRAKLGGHASPEADWLQAEREIMAKQVKIAVGQGAHPAVPANRSQHKD